MSIDYQLYYLEHHNKNLTRGQEEAIASIREYREGKYGFASLSKIVRERGFGDAVSYLEQHGADVYSKEALITFINAIFGALEETHDLYQYQSCKDCFDANLNTQMRLLEIDFDGKEQR